MGMGGQAGKQAAQWRLDKTGQFGNKLRA